MTSSSDPDETLPASTPGAGDILPANTLGADEIQVGMSVVGMDGESVGKVKALRERDFLVDRPMARDVYVPFSCVLATENPADRVRGGPIQRDKVMLTISAADVDEQHWPNP